MYSKRTMNSSISSTGNSSDMVTCDNSIPEWVRWSCMLGMICCRYNEEVVCSEEWSGRI